MEAKLVKDLMVPLDRYGVVSQDDTLHEAIRKFEEAMKKRDRRRQPFRAVLVTDEKNNIVGKLGQLAFLRALEPHHSVLSDMSKLSSSGASKEFISSVSQDYQFFRGDLTLLCSRAGHTKVKEVMHPATESIDENVTLSEAITKIVMWETLSVLVTRKGKVVGLLRLDDVCQEVAEWIKSSCGE
jgi:CBS domain-containing protein